MKKLRVLFMLTFSLFLSFFISSKTDFVHAASNKQIVFWNPFTGPDGTNMQKLINQYNKTNPEYKVKNVSLTESDMYSKIPTIVNSGKGIPDLQIVHVERIKDYVHNGLLDSYDPYLSQFPQIKGKNYVPEAWKNGKYEGHRYGVPLDIHTTFMYYNKDLVKKYAPHALDDNIVTFKEIEEAGKKSQKDGITALGLTWWKPLFLSLYGQMGGKLTKDGRNPTFNNATSKKAINLYKRLREEKITSQDGQDPMQLFLTGKDIFFPEGIWMNNQIKEGKIKYGVTNMPQISSNPNKMVNWSSSHQFVLLKQPKRSKAKTKATLKFINWVRLHSLTWAEAGQNPASLAITKNAKYNNMQQSFLLSNKTEQNSLTIFDYRYNGYLADYLDRYAYDAVFNKTSISKYLKKMQNTVQDEVDAQMAD
ncbi:sugar ABC transporter substrate-binding protein [Ligilactobacillus salitolerans]|uniref:Sugar ABC transporter substrate-binding protein n=1 Tax=Ligilactobacillus salitolerans TaxID=1808352 RepID=A0A401IQR2_9LACO|nr:extracellular solute-binding protein [Ligilactobacillus salitolerans]GBG93866.1 sugar ABC transporter substrate-binding protein [Ligilactobacillus salitolerans]